MDLEQFCKDNNIPLEKLGDIGELSDGFHTFNSLYHQRLILFATLINTFPHLAWKSHKHHDGEVPFGGGWFIVGIKTPKGQYTYHYEDKDWDLFHCPEVDTAPEWDGHTDKDVERILSLNDEPDDWARREVALACISEKESVDKLEDAITGIACYESALRAYRALTEYKHSYLSIQITKSIFNRLIDGKALTPIWDTPEVWNETRRFVDSGDAKEYQCQRMPSLFKRVKPDGTTTYSDVNRVNCIDVESPDVAFTNVIARKFVDKLYPITMPYLPPSKKFTLYLRTFLYDPKTKNSDYDTVAYLYLITPDGERAEINRYFKELAGKMVPIRKEEYERRRAESKN